MAYTDTFIPETLSRADVNAWRGAQVLEFGTDGCSHCQRAQPLVRAAFVQAGAGVVHVKVEDGPGRPLGRSFGIKLWPTLVFLRDGHEVTRLVRPQSTPGIVEALLRIH